MPLKRIPIPGMSAQQDPFRRSLVRGEQEALLDVAALLIETGTHNTWPKLKGLLRQAGIDVGDPEFTERTCLRCFKDFDSQGSHNRLCDPCRRLNDAQVAAEEDVSGSRRLENSLTTSRDIPRAPTEPLAKPRRRGGKKKKR